MTAEFVVNVSKTLTSKNVNHIIVGGCASIVYQQKSYTSDLDILIDTSTENLVNFKNFVYANTKKEISIFDFINSGLIRIVSSPYNIDFLSLLDGVTNLEAFAHSKIITVNKNKIRLISKEHLNLNLKTVKRKIYGI
jgi:predicted nucleotidyltransferase